MRVAHEMIERDGVLRVNECDCNGLKALLAK